MKETRLARMMDTEWQRVEQVLREPPSNGVPGLPTGFDHLDRLIGGFRESRLYYLAAYTSHGKSVLALQMALSVARYLQEQTALCGVHQGRVVIFCPEMSAEEVVHRWASALSSVPYELLERGVADSDQVERYHRVYQRIAALGDHLELFCNPDESVENVQSYMADADARQRAGDPPVRFVVVDYVTRLSIRNEISGYDTVSAISRVLKDLPLRYRIPLLGVAQLKRPSNVKPGEALPRPTLFSMRDSGRLEQDADVVILLYLYSRGAFVDEGEQGLFLPIDAVVEVAKQRSGALGEFDLAFVPRLTRFAQLPNRELRIHR